MNVQLVELPHHHLLVRRLTLAMTFGRRWLGWQFHRPVTEEQGLLLIPCRSIHTWWMRFPIQVTWLDRDANVLGVVERLPAWRLAVAPRGTHAVLERPAGVRPPAIGSQLRLYGSADSAARLPTQIQPWWLRDRES